MLNIIKNKKYKNNLKSNQSSDSRVNKVASIIQDDIYLLKYIKNQKKFYFKIV